MITFFFIRFIRFKNIKLTVLLGFRTSYLTVTCWKILCHWSHIQPTTMLIYLELD